MRVIHKNLITLSLLLTTIPMLAGAGAPPATPIDGGLSVLLVAGGIYGIKKISDYRKSH